MYFRTLPRNAAAAGSCDLKWEAPSFISTGVSVVLRRLCLRGAGRSKVSGEGYIPPPPSLPPPPRGWAFWIRVLDSVVRI